jgi:hypothetical protein
MWCNAERMKAHASVHEARLGISYDLNFVGSCCEFGVKKVSNVDIIAQESAAYYIMCSSYQAHSY